MKGRDQIRPAVTHEKTNRFTDIGANRVIAYHGSHRSIEDHIIGIFVDRLGHIKGLQTFLTVAAASVEFALHYVIFLVDLRHAFFRFNQNQAIHAIGNVHADRRGGAVIDVEARVERLKRELR